jgi:phage shock protein C
METKSMTTATTNKPTPLPLRNDTLLGVCEAIGQDFGFNPLWLRLAFIAPLFFAPLLTVGAYVGLGVVIALSRRFFPRVPASEQIVDVKAKPVDHANADIDLPVAA